jgi:hypothetical protein
VIWSRASGRYQYWEVSGACALAMKRVTTMPLALSLSPSQSMVKDKRTSMKKDQTKIDTRMRRCTAALSPTFNVSSNDFHIHAAIVFIFN